MVRMESCGALQVRAGLGFLRGSGGIQGSVRLVHISNNKDCLCYPKRNLAELVMELGLKPWVLTALPLVSGAEG